MNLKIISLAFILIINLIITKTYAQKILKNSDHTVNNALKTLKNDPELAAAGFSFYAIDTKTDEIIAEHNQNLVLKSASTLKLVSSATCLELYGADYTFNTTIKYNGYIDTANRILYGNIIIKGGGDPALGSQYFYQTKEKKFLSKWTDAIKNLNIDSITGSIIADADIYSQQIVPSTWTWEDMGNYFGAGACGLTVMDNFYTISIKTGKSVGDKTEIISTDPQIPELTFDNQTITSNTTSDDSFIFGAPYKYDRLITGELPLNKTNFKIKGSIPDPAWFCAYELDNFLNENNIKTNKKPTTTRIIREDSLFIDTNFTEIIITQSPKLSDIVYITNLNSINLFAEHFLCHAGIALIDNPQTEKAAQAVENFWKQKGMTTTGLSLNDGSGLSHYNAISSKQLVFILNYMKNQSTNYEAFFNSLPIAGKTGTLASVCKDTDAEGKINAKSGSIRHVRAYAGYATSDSGREIAFAMLLNNFDCSSYKARQKLETLMLALVKLNE